MFIFDFRGVYLQCCGNMVPKRSFQKSSLDVQGPHTLACCGWGSGGSRWVIKWNGVTGVARHRSRCVSIWVFEQIGVPQNGWFMMENPFKIDDLGYHYFWKHPYVSGQIKFVTSRTDLKPPNFLVAFWKIGNIPGYFRQSEGWWKI